MTPRRSRRHPVDPRTFSTHLVRRPAGRTSVAAVMLLSAMPAFAVASDAGASDAGPSDGVPSDAVASDAGPSDAGPNDEGASDEGTRRRAGDSSAGASAGTGGAAAEAPGITLLDGKVIVGAIESIGADGIRVRGQPAAVPAYEVQELRFVPLNAAAGAADDAAIEFQRGPLVRFAAGGEQIAARVVEVAPDPSGRLEVVIECVGGKLPPLRVPRDAIRGFRLREAHADDQLFEQALDAGPVDADTIFVRRAGLLAVAGTFRGLDAEYLQVERGDRPSRVRRQLVQGVLLAPAASERRDSDPPAVLELPGIGRLPAHVLGMDSEGGSPELVLRFPESAPDARTRVPVAAVRRIALASDRVLFLSAAEPVLVDERPVVGTPLRYRRDLSVSGAPLWLAKRLYRRGLGVHSHCGLTYALGGEYRSFAAVIGLDDAAGGKGSVTFRVLADGKEIFQQAADGATRPEPISLPVEKVERLELVVDYGADGLDFADHADWADARVTK